MCVLAGLAALSVCANAFTFDAQIVIDRALNSPNLSVRYTGATVVLVELKLNGESLGTRSVSAAKDSGETNFTLNLASLHDGDNTVEVCLFDRAGKLVGTQKTVISTDNNVQGPVFLTAPKIGATVHGPVAISVGFGRDLRNSYVSFFIDSQFKSLSNSPPFDYVWDTERETNGWHEVEAWVIDDSSTTFKTRKIRVLVNNGGGRTERFTAPTSASPRLTALTNGKTGGTGNAKGLKPVTTGAGTATEDNIITSVAPGIEGSVAANTFNPTVGKPSPAKQTLIAQSIATGPRFLTPTGTRVAGPTIAALKATTSGAATIAMTKGQRWPNLGTLSILYNSSVVHFDVMPRIQDGVPMTPFRYLLEKAGGTVDWVSLSKSVKAQADGRDIFLTIGDKMASINKLPIELELAPFLERGRTIVPLSFLRDALNVNIEYDKATGHVLITSTKKQ